jgi:hypothetical protein
MVFKYVYQHLARSSTIYPNWDFWFENVPSGNPSQHNEDMTRHNLEMKKDGEYEKVFRPSIDYF